MKKSGQYLLLSKKLEKWFQTQPHFTDASYHTIPSIDNPLHNSFDTIDIKSICDKIKTLDKDFKMDLHISSWIKCTEP